MIVPQKGINTREPKWRGVHCEKRYNDEGQESAPRWEVNSWRANWELNVQGGIKETRTVVSISQQDRSSRMLSAVQMELRILILF